MSNIVSYRERTSSLGRLAEEMDLPLMIAGGVQNPLRDVIDSFGCSQWRDRSFHRFKHGSDIAKVYETDPERCLPKVEIVRAGLLAHENAIFGGEDKRLGLVSRVYGQYVGNKLFPSELTDVADGLVRYGFGEKINFAYPDVNLIAEQKLAWVATGLWGLRARLLQTREVTSWAQSMFNLVMKAYRQGGVRSDLSATKEVGEEFYTILGFEFHDTWRVVEVPSQPDKDNALHYVWCVWNQIENVGREGDRRTARIYDETLRDWSYFRGRMTPFKPYEVMARIAKRLCELTALRSLEGAERRNSHLPEVFFKSLQEDLEQIVSLGDRCLRFEKGPYIDLSGRINYHFPPGYSDFERVVVAVYQTIVSESEKYG